MAFTIFALDSLFSFLNFATDLPRANLCKSFFSSSNISTPNISNSSSADTQTIWGRVSIHA